MALESPEPGSTLDSMTEIWGNMVFWAFLATTLVYLGTGIVYTFSLGMWRKGVSFVVPLVFLGCGELKVLFGDAIACAFVSGIYVTSGWSMSALNALGWGVGLSLLSVVCSVLISLVPMYAFL